MIQKLIDAVRSDVVLTRLDETNKQLARIADALERITPQLTETALGDNEEVFIDPYTPETDVDESYGLGSETGSVASGK